MLRPKILKVQSHFEFDQNCLWRWQRYKMKGRPKLTKPVMIDFPSFQLLPASNWSSVSISSIQRLFAYVTQEKYEENGWTVYKPVEEFRRQVRTSEIPATSVLVVNHAVVWARVKKRKRREDDEIGNNSILNEKVKQKKCWKWKALSFVGLTK